MDSVYNFQYTFIMSIFPQMAAMILKEHKYRPINGDILLIGRQTVNLTVANALELIRSEGITPRDSYQVELDSSTVGSETTGYITDRCFFAMFSSAGVIALDVSDYEDAEIIHDLNIELPEKYFGIADFIFNGSCLDNLFDPATAIKSISKMLRPQGRVIHLEHGSPIQSSFLCYSPEWFFDYYAFTDYADCQIYVCSFGASLQNSWIVNRWFPFEGSADSLKPTLLNMGVGDFVNIVIAEKSETSSDVKTPIQCHYRFFQNDMTQDIYVRKHLEYLKSPRVYAFRRQLDLQPVIPDTLPPPPRIIILPAPKLNLNALSRAFLKELKNVIRKKVGLTIQNELPLSEPEAVIHDEVSVSAEPVAAKLSSFYGVLMR